MGNRENPAEGSSPSHLMLLPEVRPDSDNCALENTRQEMQGLKENSPRFSEELSIPQMRVLFVICNLDRGGTETQAVELARRLTLAHCQVTVATLQDGPLREALEKDGIRIVDFPKKGSLLSFRGLYQFIRLLRFIRREKFDVVHSHDLWANLVAVPAAKFAGAPVVFSSQRDLAHLYWYTPFRKKIIGRIHRWSTAVIVNSSAVSNLVQKEFHVPARRVCVVRNGVAFERFASLRANRRKLFPGVDQNTKLIVTVANMHTAVKGHYELIEAARRLKSTYPDAKFVLVGDGAERSNLEESSRAFGVQDSVLFLGRRTDIPELLACCDVFVLPSHAEGLPNSLLEAMATGLPVLATPVGGVPEVIENGVNGLLVPPRDPTSLADALLRILRDPEFATRLAVGGREGARSQFSFDRAVSELESIYETRKS
jgi:L-malate glycosyltransferase